MDEAFIYGRVIVCEALAECPITLPYMKAESIIREEIYSRKILFVLSDTLNIKKVTLNLRSSHPTQQRAVLHMGHSTRIKQELN